MTGGAERVDPYAEAASRRGHTIAELVAALEPWLAQRLGAAAVHLSDAQTPVGAGTSSETLLATAAWEIDGVAHQREVVFRVHPDRFQLFLEPAFELQFRVLEALRDSGSISAPEPILYESDTSVIGLPFFMMARCRGRVPVSRPPYNASGFLFEATPAERHIAWRTAAEELARIALVPVESMSFLGRPDLGPTAIEQQLAYWRAMLRWASDGRPPEALERLAAWLDAQLPADRAAGFSWGDARIGNMVFGDDFRLRCVLDWEQANIGGVRQDLGWWLFFDIFHSTTLGLARLPGLGSRAETIGVWESIVGQPAGDITWYEVFAGYKVAVLSMRSMIIMGLPDALEVPRNLAAVQALDLAGLPVGG